MNDDKQRPKGWQELPQDQLQDNAFQITPDPVWPHLCLEWKHGRHILTVYAGHPRHDEALLRIELETLIVAEAEWSFEERHNGKVMPQWISESNAELELKAQALEALAARLRQRHKRPEVVGGNGGRGNG
jgi:hypothetical protein